MSEVGEEWIDQVFSITEQFLRGKLTTENTIFQDELSELKTFTKCVFADAFNFENPEMIVFKTFHHDFLGWLNSKPETLLQNYSVETPLSMKFSFKKEQLEMKRDAMKRYGRHLSGVVKLIQRVGGMHRFMLKVAYGSMDKVGDSSTAQFTAQPRANSSYWLPVK